MTHECPSWCEGGHDPGEMHYRQAGLIRRGAAEIEVSVRYKPGSFTAALLPVVMIWARGIPGAPSVVLAPIEAADFAGLMAVLGHEDLAGLVRQAAALAGGPLT